MNYSLNVGVNWRDFDFSMLWQGSALGSMEYKEPLYSIWGDMGGGILEQYTDRWHPVNRLQIHTIPQLNGYPATMPTQVAILAATLHSTA